MLYRLLHILGVFAFVLALVPAAVPAVERYRLHVVGEKGEPMPRFQAMLYAGKGETTGWIEGKEGEVSFPAFRRDPPLLRVLARADNYAATVLLREGAELEKIRRGDATTALSRGEKVQLRFCLPPEIGLPETILPGVYYDFCKEEVYRLRRSAHQLHPEQPDLKLIAVNRTAPDRYEVRLAHRPGILRRPPCRWVSPIVRHGPVHTCRRKERRAGDPVRAGWFEYPLRSRGGRC